MSVVDDFLKKMKTLSEDEDDLDEDYDDDYDDLDGDEEDDELYSGKRGKTLKKSKKDAPKHTVSPEPEDDEEEDSDDADFTQSAYSAPHAYKQPSSSFNGGKNTAAPQERSAKVVGMDGAAAGRKAPEVCMIVPKSFDDANTIADVLLSNRAVVLNLESIDMAAAQRIIDFASGSCYTVGGNLQKISKKIFIVVPSGMNLSGDFDKLMGDMIDLNSVNILK